MAYTGKTSFDLRHLMWTQIAPAMTDRQLTSLVTWNQQRAMDPDVDPSSVHMALEAVLTEQKRRARSLARRTGQELIPARKSPRHASDLRN